MNILLLEFARKLLSLLVISFMSLFNLGNYNEVELKTDNLIKDTSIISTVTKYKTVYKYNSKLPSNVKKVITPGINEVAYKTSENETVQVIQEKVDEVVEVGTGRNGNYTGKLSGYGPDCVGCTGTGNLACKTREKKTHSLVNDGIYYEDTEFGKVRIVAAALKGFPCGTIIQITKPGKDSFTAIVLDTGASMANSWAQGKVWMDLAYPTQKDKTVFGADGLTGNNINFSVQRWGW